MMSRTHLAVGIAVSLALLPEQGLYPCALAVAGGALGGVTPDIDILNDDYKHDALIGQIIAYGISIAVFLVNYISGHNLIGDLAVGGILYAVLLIIGFKSKHRMFTHSILAMFLYSAAIEILTPKLGYSFLIGYFSHLIIDLLNKKGIQILFPLKFKPCLHICYASKTGNKILMWVGVIASILFLAVNLLYK